MSRVVTVPTSLVGLLVVLSACGGGDDAAGTTAPSTGPSAVTATVAESTTTVSTTVAPVTVAPTTVFEIEDATPWAVELSEPTGPRLDGWAAAEPVAPEVGDPPAGIDAQLTWLYTDLIERWRDDPRLASVGMSDPAFGRSHREAVPGAVIDVIGASAVVLRDTQAVVAAHAESVAEPGQTGAPMFSAWAEYASGWSQVAEAVRLAMAAARDLDPDDQTCLLATLDGDDDCDGPGAALADELDATIRAMPLGDLEIDDPGSYAAAGLEFDECLAWDAAVEATGLSADEELRIWVTFDDSDLDRFVLSRSECGWVDDRTEDPEIDGDADEASFLGYLSEIAAAIVESGYDETIYDFGSGAEDEKRYFEYTSAEAVEHVVNVARDTASQQWREVWDPELAVKLYAVTAIEIDDWVELDDFVLDWDDLGTRVCEAWEVVVADYDEAERVVIDAAVSELGFRDTIIPEAC